MDELIRIWDRIVDTLEKATVDNLGLKKIIGERARSFVISRTKSGVGVIGRKAAPLRELKPSYIKQRRNLQRAGVLASDTSPAKSNMTKTGELLKDLGADITATGAIVYIKESDNREKVKNQPKDRQIMDLTKEEIEKIERTVAASIVSAFRNFK